jgi:murein DD-endopeptidase MepM/ murein hydrolase activator NlpD
VYVLYGHVLNIGVQPGEQVVRGQQLAEVGVGGAATLPHLHLEVRVGTNEFQSTRNPLLWINPANNRGLIAGRLVDPGGRPWQGVAVNAIGRSEETEDRTTWTYLDDALHTINPDEQWAENFVFGDLKPGEYELYIQLQGSVYKELIKVDGGQLSFTEIITEPYRTPTPTVSTEVLEPSPTVGAETTPS